MIAAAKTRVLLIEDNRFVQGGVAGLLRSRGGFTVTMIAGSDDLAARLEGIRPPDVGLLDLSLGSANGLAPMAVLRRRIPESRIIAIGVRPEQDGIIDFVRAGGCGFILKNASATDYVTTIQAVAGGSMVLPAILTKSLFAQVVESVVRSGAAPPDRGARLTPREREVVDLIAQGMSNKDIAERLHVATYTVKSHVHSVLEKLELRSRLQIAALVHEEQPFVPFRPMAGPSDSGPGI